ncbi:unnamed protein product [Coregonus sp. 'balchen']|nr:unnamed protein product [Coregonus sp. 'balchen']
MAEELHYSPVVFKNRVVSSPKERKCNPCRHGWMLFQSSCYQILYPPAPWNTWEQSRMDCKQNNADLVVIGSQKEQEFIHNHTQYYYDKDHGYWIGLNDIAKVGQWLWVSGSHQNLTDGFWKRQTGGDCVLTVPNNAPLDNWNAESCSMQNRWICEISISLSEHSAHLVKELEQLTDDHISLLAANQDLMNLYCKLSAANHILQSDYINVSTENQQLKAARMNLSRDRDGLNWTLGVIFQLKNFPVDNYCPYKNANTKVPFGHLWRTWQGSRQHCKNNNADLVDIDSQEEQEFILNTQAHYDEVHGYWIGLTDIAEDGQWLWVDGRHQKQQRKVLEASACVGS